jgi:hypothetical protein
MGLSADEAVAVGYRCALADGRMVDGRDWQLYHAFRVVRADRIGGTTAAFLGVLPRAAIISLVATGAASTSTSPVRWHEPYEAARSTGISEG